MRSYSAWAASFSFLIAAPRRLASASDTERVFCVLMAGYLWLRSRAGLADADRPRDFRIVHRFWHYTTALWLIAVVLVFLFPGAS